jgi:UDP-N-acetyl-D-glucosamine dehydrogenase
VLFHDPFTDQVDIDGRVIEVSSLSRRLLTSVDCVAVLTPHSAYDLDWVAEHSMLVFDAHNAYGSATHDNVITL